MSNEQQVMRLLDISEDAASRVPKKASAAMQSRLIGLGHGSACSRCGGSGQYSYCAMYGTTCFKCGGSGFVVQKITNKLLAAVQADHESGKVREYLDDLRKRTDNRRACRNAVERVMAAWKSSGVSKAYDWRKCQTSEVDRRIADEINKPMCDAYDRVQKLSFVVEFELQYERRKAETTDARAAVDAKIDAAYVELAHETEVALAIIAECTKCLKEFSGVAA